MVEVMKKIGAFYYDLVLIFQADFANGLSYPVGVTHFTVNFQTASYDKELEVLD